MESSIGDKVMTRIYDKWGPVTYPQVHGLNDHGIRPCENGPRLYSYVSKGESLRDSDIDTSS